MYNENIGARAINTIRFLAADAVQNANSGHPGLPMGTAALAYVIWTRHLKFDPASPDWPDRDRFVLSAGHGSMLLYALLHLTGYEMTIDDIKHFRQWGSITPGHPEYDLTHGVETTTGPLGQGFGNGVGMAIAAEHLAAKYNKPGYPIVDHRIYAIVSDGDLMEGVASEAASLAGHLKLGRLVYLYDDNRITIDGSTDLTFTEDRAKRFEAYGWHTSFVEDGNDVEAIDEAISAAKADPRPSIILCRTHIGYGMPTRQDTAAAHGQPPGEEELAGAKDKLGWPQEPRFLIPEEVKEHFSVPVQKGAAAREAWEEMFKKYKASYPEEVKEFERTQEGVLPVDLTIPTFEADEQGMATRVSSGKVLNEIGAALPELIGGSADLTGSNKTDIKGEEHFSAENRAGRYLYFGVREHGMGSILNGIALHGGLIPYGGTFLVFSDYMRPSIRLAALMEQRVIYVLTHDSIGLGEDGPTHQPIEQLAALRSIPNLVVIRPADANETAEAWRVALARDDGPTVLALTRQAIPTLDREHYAPANGLSRGAYILKDLGDGPPEIILMASGSEVDLVVQASEKLAAKGLSTRVVSFPSWELYAMQGQDYRDEICPSSIQARVAIEAGVPLGWRQWVGDFGEVIGIERFGASAPYKELYQQYGLTVERIIDASQKTLERTRKRG
ncbi:MAG: transketolase [Anaerolineales bacterium]|nr:transketolase [Anaerolineales bacterium]